MNLTEILTRFEFANKESWTKRYDPERGSQVTGDYILLQMAKNELPQVTRELMRARKVVEAAQILMNTGAGDITNLRAELERYHWIPVKERLPEIDALVLLYLENEKESKITTGKIYKSDNPQFDGEFCIGFDPICPDFLKREYVTHWMPLPMGPEGVERDG